MVRCDDVTLTAPTVRDFNIAEKEEDISYYAGFVGSSYMIGRALTSVFLGVVADRYGRKPVILLGTSTVVIFNTLFGFSVNYWMAISARFFLGFLNGLLGTAKAYACEIFPEEYQALAMSSVIFSFISYAIMEISTSWGIGLIIGPALGGFLAQPAEKFPSLVSSDSLFGRFPYLLPCLCISFFALIATIASFWLPETLHFHKKNELESAEEERDEKKILIFSLWAESPKSLGGLNYSTDDVGTVLSITESKVLSIPLLTAYPYIALLSGFMLAFTLNAASMVKNVLSDQHQRGAANGISMTLQSICKAIGPACGGAL
ncbi:hypothetical protein L1987_43575 [Smallanthus sonchifolius]|uniref:Uncharacterized protein n=1 Tax=Smallanthus sonchifolius TaxID=185202 RepID=A0ACB9GMQ5_9ASTR|nr:hypothetical protein L1987_43575 [Smallanthus sonchifolius]